jgi:hypothetical protein
MLFTEMGEVLYVGADDSNHAGTTKGEIIVAMFSLLYRDSIVKDFQNRRDYQEVARWLEKEERDCRFTICTAEQYRHSSQNLPNVVPTLVKNYLETSGKDINRLCVYLDGGLALRHKEAMRRKLRRISGIKSVVVDNFIKKNTSEGEFKRKGYHCPKLVWVADGQANHLFRNGGSLETMLQHEKMVALPKMA